ncbi:MAG: DUF3048 domain-containing protein [Bacilli bacterium]|nr:DUF3048 domain-containing protein [Bacilli bacterium]
MDFILNRSKAQKIIILIIFLLLLGTLVYFSFFNKKEEQKNSDKEEQEEEVIEPIKKLQIIDEKSDSRTIAVMINNHNQARPNHAGLQDAYIMYEVIVEGGITRMMALYKDASTAKIGSVRSSRPYFLDYALENDAIYVHFGYSDQAKADIASLNINNINGLSDSAFWRDTTLNVNYEHTAYTSIEKIKSVLSSKNYKTTSDKDTLLNYSIDVVDLSLKSDAVLANTVTIPYSNYMTVSYTYDSVNQYYLRFANSVAHTDAITNNQYHFKNIIVINVENYSVDSYGRQALNNVGTGTGYYITNGYAVPITWEKTSRASQTVYKYVSGEEIDVNDGNTFIQIQPIKEVTTLQ